MKIDIENLERIYNINTEDMYETAVCELYDDLRNMLPDIIKELKVWKSFEPLIRQKIDEAMRDAIKECGDD